LTPKIEDKIKTKRKMANPSKRRLNFGLYFGQIKIKISQEKNKISEKAIKYKLFGPTKGKKKFPLIIKGVNKIK
jgi:hypothetical protein